jgi:hypothetical protein
MREMNAYRSLMGTLLENNHLKDEEGDGRMTAKWILGK